MKEFDNVPCKVSECPRSKICRRAIYEQELNENYQNNPNSLKPLHIYHAIIMLGKEPPKECKFYYPIEEIKDKE